MRRQRDHSYRSKRDPSPGTVIFVLKLLICPFAEGRIRCVAGTEPVGAGLPSAGVRPDVDAQART